jgi:ABC-type transport system substrate-binding protein
MLKEWKRASRVVLEANPHYRDLQFPESTNPRQYAVVQSMRGKTLPQIGRIEVSIIEESQPDLLAFARGDLDYVALAGDDLNRVLIGNELKPELARKGKLMMFNLAYRSLQPSGYEILQTLWSRSTRIRRNSRMPTTTAPTSSSCRRPLDRVASGLPVGCPTSRRPICQCSSRRSGFEMR